MSERSLAVRRKLIRRWALYQRVAKRRLGIRSPSGPPDHWARTVLNREIAGYVSAFDVRSLAAVEITGTFRRDNDWASYTNLEYPRFDICEPYTGPTYDIVFCEQVLQHVRDACAGARTLHAICRPGGHVIVSTSFLIRIDPTFGDFWRFTPDGLRVLLQTSGLEVIDVGSWGNRAAVTANFVQWAPQTWWRSLQNEPEFPLVVWALARRPSS